MWLVEAPSFINEKSNTEKYSLSEIPDNLSLIKPNINDIWIIEDLEAEKESL